MSLLYVTFTTPTPVLCVLRHLGLSTITQVYLGPFFSLSRRRHAPPGTVRVVVVVLCRPPVVQSSVIPHNPPHEQLLVRLGAGGVTLYPLSLPLPLPHLVSFVVGPSFIVGPSFPWRPVVSLSSSRPLVVSPFLPLSCSPPPYHRPRHHAPRCRLGSSPSLSPFVRRPPRPPLSRPALLIVVVSTRCPPCEQLLAAVGAGAECRVPGALVVPPSLLLSLVSLVVVPSRRRWFIVEHPQSTWRAGARHGGSCSLSLSVIK